MPLRRFLGIVEREKKFLGEEFARTQKMMPPPDEAAQRPTLDAGGQPRARRALKRISKCLRAL